MIKSIHKTTRSHFLHILLNKDSINTLPPDKMRRIIGRIMDDLDKDGILDPVDYLDDYDELEEMFDIEFNNIKPEHKNIILEFLTKTDSTSQNEDTISSVSLERIRRKRQELAKDPRSGIRLSSYDLEDNKKDIRVFNSYGRSAAHEAIAMRNLEAVRKYVNEGLYLTEIDNNGNTPYQMAFQEGYTEAVEIFEAAGIFT